MDQILKAAAEAGNVSELYEFIEKNGNFLRHIDNVEFIETPLHIAAENGCIGFAMEIMSLKPSFARKLNHRGLSPLHLAVEKGHKELALRLLEIDKDLVRIRGKNGETPFHYLSKVEKRHDLLDRFLDACPECIRDVTAQNHSALHIAIKNNRFDVLKVLIRSLRMNDYYQDLLNRQDEDGNTALHIAATNNQPQMLRLLLECEIDKHLRNLADETALDVARHTKCIHILRGILSPKISNSTYELKKKIVKNVTKTSLLIFHGMDNISSEDRNVSLVVLGLLLTTTYQASLSPPASVLQGDGKPAATEDQLGTIVMDPSYFLLFYIPTYVVFIVSFLLTLALLKPFPRGFRTSLQVLLAFLAISFDQSIYQIAPTKLASDILGMFSGIIFILMAFMSIAYHVSNFSVAIVGSWIFPFHLLGVPEVECAAKPLLSFLFLHDEFWIGTILVVGLYFYQNIPLLMYHENDDIVYPIVSVGFWLFLHLCRFGTKHCTRLCGLFY